MHEEIVLETADYGILKVLKWDTIGIIPKVRKWGTLLYLQRSGGLFLLL